MAKRTDHVDAEFVEAKGAALAVVRDEPPAPVGLFGTDDPVQVIEKATKVADALKAVVVSKNLISNIQGKEHPQVEAWLTLAAMLGISAICEWTRKLDNGWEARAIVVNAAGQTIGAADAQCTREERMWAKRDDYALRSMAQTRATSKALRSKLGFIMTLAGYQATPAEEMPNDHAPVHNEPAATITKDDLIHLAGTRGVDLMEFITAHVRGDYPETGKLRYSEILETKRLLEQLDPEIPM